MGKFGYHTTSPEVVEAFKSEIKGKTFVVTGPSSGGLGAETAIYLASGNPDAVILLGRTFAKIQPVIDSIRSISPDTNVHFISVDLSSNASVREAASQLVTKVAKIDVLINNAGIMALHDYTTSVDGVEMQFAANHLGHFLLTNLLFPLLEAAGPGSRVINVSSAGHALGDVRFTDVNFNNGTEYNEWVGYGQAKCANVLFALTLAKRWGGKGIQAFSLHPGNISETNLGANLVDPNWPYVMGLFEKLGRIPPGTKSMSEGCATGLVAALDPSLKDSSGAYLDDCVVVEPTAFAKDATNGERLWRLSEELVNQKFTY